MLMKLQPESFISSDSMDVLFYQGNQFPERYKKGAFFGKIDSSLQCSKQVIVMMMSSADK